jgi:hypothetical protein
MTDRGIPFSGPMVRALLAGRKTQTRRVLKPQVAAGAYRLATYDPQGAAFFANEGGGALQRVCLPYAPGDRLYVREAHSLHGAHGQSRADGKRWGPWGGLPTAISPDGTQIAYYREGFDRCDPGRWRPSTNMPRWASRLTLIVTDVRVQRLQDISEADAVAEGVDAVTMDDVPRQAAMSRRSDFAALWNSLHGPDAWAANPWVAALAFTAHRCNIDQMGDTDDRA